MQSCDPSQPTIFDGKSQTLRTARAFWIIKQYLTPCHTSTFQLHDKSMFSQLDEQEVTFPCYAGFVWCVATPDVITRPAS